jgi:hypothetical protein
MFRFRAGMSWNPLAAGVRSNGVTHAAAEAREKANI